MLYLKEKNQITSKFNFCWENLGIDQVNTIFKFQRRFKQMDHYHLNTFWKKFFFDLKTLINFRSSLKVSLSQNPWCFLNKQKNLPREKGAPMVGAILPLTSLKQAKQLSICVNFSQLYYLKRNNVIQKKLAFEIWGKFIEVLPSVKLPEVQIDDKLNFNLHITNIYRSTAKQLNALIRLKWFLSWEGTS